jgi:hypothetical protein
MVVMGEVLILQPQPYTVKKDTDCHLPNSPRQGIIKPFPARERLVSDIPAGDGKIKN